MTRKEVGCRVRKRKSTIAKRSTNAAEKKTSTISLWGYGVSLRWVPIGKRNFKRLTVDGTSFEEVRAYFDRSGGGGIGGALNGRCGIYLDDRKLRDIRLGLKRAEVVRIGGNAKYLLVEEMWEKGDFVSGEIEGEYDKKKLLLGLDRYALSDGTVYNFVCFGYAADKDPDFDMFDVSDKETIHVVVTRDGKRHPVIFNDE
ncbi:MAG: hypothetical protein ACREUW_04765 [Burkholderiales bacterium]